jgi:hypothetical protein
MTDNLSGTEQGRPRYREWLRGALIFLVVVVLVRFGLEAAGVPHSGTRYLSSMAAILLAAIYLGVVAPLRGVRKFSQLLVPAVAVAGWTQAWVMLVTVITAVFRLERSHFAEPEDLGNWGHLGGHLVGHVVEAAVLSLLVFIIMAVPFVLWRWPVLVGPGAMLGALVVVRFWVEAMDMATAGIAFSSTVGILVSAFYLGGMAPRIGLTTRKQILVPALVLGWTWRFWVLLATLLSALVPFYKTHFFDPSGGRVAARLASFFVFGFVVEGLIAGLLVWGIALWIARATRPLAEA